MDPEARSTDARRDAHERAPGSFSGSGGDPSSSPGPGLRPPEQTLPREIMALRERLIHEATLAVGMLELACDALTRLDPATARSVIERDDEIDREEVHIEEQCFRLLALFQPFARDFRTVVSLLRVNADLERVGDHACSIAKQTIKLRDLGAPRLPTALVELAQRVPIVCHTLLRTLQNEDVESARRILAKDVALDLLDKRLFDECVDAIGPTRESRAAGLRMYRCGRELERVGDLMASIAEDVMYLATGSIVRHDEKRRLKAEARKRMEA